MRDYIKVCGNFTVRATPLQLGQRGTD